MSDIEDVAEVVITRGMTKAQIQGAIVMAWRTTLIVHVLWAWGLFAWAGAGSGFALAETQKEMRLADIEERLIATRIQQCEAIAAQKSARIYTERLNDLEKKRKQLSKEPFPLPACQELL